MTTLVLLAVITLPQLWAARRRFGPAAHLTLLMLSLSLIMALYVWGGFLTSTTAEAATPLALNLTYLGFAAMGTAGLVPLFWALEQMFPTYDFSIATVLAQALGLVFTATLLPVWGQLAALPPLLEGGALALVIALYGVGLHVVHKGELE